jgi:hypothetical protein
VGVGDGGLVSIADRVLIGGFLLITVLIGAGLVTALLVLFLGKDDNLGVTEWGKR